MKKENIAVIWSWFFVGWFTFAILSTIRIGIVHGLDSIDFQFTMAIALIMGIPMTYFLLKAIKKKEFRLKPNH